eukprot:CAMPEP_0206190078 /NCGR_PEP_ID=MMETSP0166-20121206/4536_1 /ASSEMBLY_ACC=CAM_ASM_000260 /TAXON_ID=95228 /ORGANISM="Vannella robusta, Strain DIVA3 518/3/11/1/6" /LENGTH=484 /DNA_ID=CAMNT_0053606089 /DNA_START=187 /DNA_END=1638 /DNA_ORIENTATION=+
MAVGGDVNLQSYSVGQALTFQCKRTDLLVGNNLVFVDGEVERGKITYRGTSTLTDVGLGCTSSQSSADLIDFDSSFTTLNETAHNIQKHITTAFTRTSDTTITFKGIFQNKNYFKIDSATLEGTTNIHIDVPENASATISVSGERISISSLGITLSGTTDVQRILWSMYEAEEVEIANIQLFGSILAPLAHTTLVSGSILGSVASRRLTGEASIEYSPYIPPDANCTCIDCPPIWFLPPYSLFAFESVEMSQSQDNGRIAAGGDVTLESFSIGSSLVEFPITTNSTIVGGNLDFSFGAIHGGNVIVAGTASLTDVAVNNGKVYPNTPIDIDFIGQSQNLTFNTRYFSKLISNGQSSLLYSTLTLYSADTGLNVFTLTSSEFNSATNVVIECPETSWAVINVPDEEAALEGIFVQLVGITANRVIYNFYEATSLTVASVGVEGSILAPLADVSFPSGNINGNLVCKSVTGAGSTSKYLPLPLRPP